MLSVIVTSYNSPQVLRECLERLTVQPEAGEIIVELQKHRGAQWDPDVVDVVLRLIATGELVLSAGGLRLLELAPVPGDAQ